MDQGLSLQSSAAEPELGRRVAAGFVAEVHARPRLEAAVRGLLELLAEREAAARLYACGGLVRDLAVAATRGGAVVFRDVDLVVEGVSSRRLGPLLGELSARCRAVRWVERVGASFPVWKLGVAGLADPVDVAVARSRSSFGVGRGALVEEAPGLTVEDDARHRDFTINALFVELALTDRGELEGVLRDVHHGLKAVAWGEVRCVGDPGERLAEDPVRALRAVRFAVSLPGFRLDTATAAAIRERAAGWLSTVARDRVADELYRALVADAPRALDLLSELDLLRELLPGLAAGGAEARQRAAARIAALAALEDGPPHPPLLFAALLLDLAAPQGTLSATRPPAARASGRVGRVARELLLPRLRTIGRLCSAVQLLLHLEQLESADAVLEEVLGEWSDPRDVLALYRSSMDAEGRAAIDVAGRLAALSPSGLDFGRLVERAGLPVGPSLQRVKLALRQAEIEGRVVGEEDALAWLRRHPGCEAE